jgi:putative transposase
MVFHVLNRGVARMLLFEKSADYQAFTDVLRETRDHSPIQICAYSLMPNHSHLLLWPEHDGELASFMQRLTITHVRRWQEHRGYSGLGHVYQGRYKSFPVQCDEHLLTVARYVERNAVGAALAEWAEQWPYASLSARSHAEDPIREVLADWPIERPADWVERVNTPLSAGELKRMRRSVVRGSPFGTDVWADRTARRLGLEHTLRPEGRPPKQN